MTTALEAFSADCSDIVESVSRSIVAVRGRYSAGTGIHWRKGLIVTSCEAISADDNLSLVLPNGQTAQTKLLGSDPTTDIAILSLPEEVDISVVSVGDSQALALGQLVLTVGQSLSGGDRRYMRGGYRRSGRRRYRGDRSAARSTEHSLSRSVDRAASQVFDQTEAQATEQSGGEVETQPFSLFSSLGIVSQIGDAWRSQAGGQIDRRIVVSLGLRRGSAGCPLINASGQVVGFNTFGPRRSVLSIPATNVNRLLDQLQQRGKISRGYLGLSMQIVSLPDNVQQQHNLTQSTGIMIVGVEPDSAADSAGMVLGDVMIAVDEMPLESLQQVQALLNPQSVGQTLSITLLRAGSIQSAEVTVGER